MRFLRGLKKDCGLRPVRRGIACLALALVCAAAFVHPALSDKPADKADLVKLAAFRAPAQAKTITLIRGMADVVDVGGPVSDIMVANPKIVDVTAIQANKLYIVGSNIGSTNIITLDENGNVVGRFDAHVTLDDGPIQSFVNATFPEEKIKVNALGDQVILTGHVSSPDVSQKVANVVASYIASAAGKSGTSDELISNMLEVEGKQQVMLRVRVLEISRNILREIGVSTTIDDLGGLQPRTITSVPGLVPGNALLGSVSTGISETPLGALGVVAQLGSFGPITAQVTALEQDGLAKILAEPNLTAISGETAGFLAGGEFPVPSGRDQDGNITIQFRSFGVSLNFKPVVLSEDKISIQLNTEVSSISRANQVTLAGVQVPGLDVRRATTTVEMGSGGTLMIAGLLQSQAVKQMSDLPGIKDIPILGDLIRSDSFRRQESEMVVLVSPYLVDSFADKNQAAEKPAPAPRAAAAEKSALPDAFESNIRRTYGKLRLGKVFEGDRAFGYILD
jgi:pilus assembly protein CpaC